MIKLNQSNGVIELRFEVEGYDLSHAYARCELLTNTDDYDTHTWVTCEYTELNGEDVADAMMKLCDSDEAPDSLTSEGEPTYAVDRIAASADIRITHECSTNAAYRVTIVDAPELADDPDIYIYCRFHAAQTMGLQLIDTLI